MNNAIFNKTISAPHHGGAKTESKRQGTTKFNRILNGQNVKDSMYPWEALVINRIPGTCRSDRLEDVKWKEPGGEADLLGVYNLCSGSLITSKHILTSAECLLKNRKEMEDEWMKDNFIDRRMIPQYSKPECLFVTLGYMDKNKAVDNSKDIKTVKKRHIHDQALSAISEYNYNIGK